LAITFGKRAAFSPNASPHAQISQRLALQTGEAGGEKVLGNSKGFTHLPSPYSLLFVDFTHSRENNP
jgi:hypothetical protein